MKCCHGSGDMRRNHGKVVIGRDVSFWAIIGPSLKNVWNGKSSKLDWTTTYVWKLPRKKVWQLNIKSQNLHKSLAIIKKIKNLGGLRHVNMTQQ